MTIDILAKIITKIIAATNTQAIIFISISFRFSHPLFHNENYSKKAREGLFNIVSSSCHTYFNISQQLR